MAEPAIDLDALLLQLHEVKRSGDGYKARCPAHEDRTASLSVSVGRSGAILLNCFAGCAVDAICSALNLSARQLFPPKTVQSLPQIVATYDYRDARGDLQYQVCRFVPKDFRQRRPNGAGGWLWNMQGVARIPYRLNELKGHATVYVCEGEKDADALWAIGLPATTNVGGAGKWKDSDSAALHAIGAQRIVIVPDNDAPGQKHAHVVAQSVKSLGLAVLKLTLPELAAKGDVSDWIAKGHTRSEFDALVSATLYVMPRGVALPGDNDALTVNGEGDSPAAQWTRSELGAAEAFVHRFGVKLRFDHRRDHWLVWNCHHWYPDETRAVERLAHEHVRAWQREAMEIQNLEQREAVAKYALSCEARGRFDHMLRFACELDAVKSAGHEWNRDPWLLGCVNGIVDLRTGAIRDGLPSDHVTMQVGAVYDAKAIAPKWEQFLLDVFDGDLAMLRYVQRALGYSLTGIMDEQCFFMCLGHGSNGKSTFLSTIEAIWGRYAYTTSMATFTVSQHGNDSDFNLAELDGPRVILASETKTDSRLNEQLLKNFTGGERINAQRKHGHPFVYQPVGKIWVGLNHQPTVRDDSLGFWRRVRVVNFPRSFTGSAVNTQLARELREEGPGILAWAVRGCLDWQANGFETPHSVMTAVEDYKDAEDPLRDFIAECLDLDDSEAEETFSDLYEVYQIFQQKLGTQTRFIPSRKSFGRSLSRRLVKRDSNGKHLYIGVRIKLKFRTRLSGYES